jgi:excisionase family DNA binding protein
MLPDPDEPLTIPRKESARLIGVSLATIDYMIGDGRLKAIRVKGRKGSRGRVLVIRSSLDTALTELTIAPRS